MPWPGVTEESIVCTECGWLDNDQADSDLCPRDCDGTMKMAAEIYPAADFDEDGNYIGEP